jgi:hypothetical protein
LRFRLFGVPGQTPRSTHAPRRASPSNPLSPTHLVRRPDPARGAVEHRTRSRASFACPGPRPRRPPCPRRPPSRPPSCSARPGSGRGPSRTAPGRPSFPPPGPGRVLVGRTMAESIGTRRTPPNAGPAVISRNRPSARRRRPPGGTGRTRRPTGRARPAGPATGCRSGPGQQGLEELPVGQGGRRAALVPLGPPDQRVEGRPEVVREACRIASPPAQPGGIAEGVVGQGQGTSTGPSLTHPVAVCKVSRVVGSGQVSVRLAVGTNRATPVADVMTTATGQRFARKCSQAAHQTTGTHRLPLDPRRGGDRLGRSGCCP